MNKIELEIVDLVPSDGQSGSFTLVLGEKNGSLRLPIIIGVFEAQSIAIEMEKITASRPLTHDLFKSFSKAFDFTIDEIIITELSEGVFYSKIICSDGLRLKNIDARPSDAVSLALRFNAPIFATQNVIEEAAIETNEKPMAKKVAIKVKTSNDITTLALEELNKMLEDALSKEEYEKAAKIRDEIDSRN